MERKAWLLPLVAIMAVLLAGSAMAAITVTMNEPAGNITVNNTAANTPTFDINFTVIDSNSTAATDSFSRGEWIECYYYEVGAAFGKAGTKITDWNGQISTDADQNCVHPLDSDGAWADPGKDCTFRWTVPTTLDQTIYNIDCNAVAWYDANNQGAVDYHDENANSDTNATFQVTVNNRLANSAAIQALMQPVVLVLAGVVLLAILSISVAIGALDLHRAMLIGIAALIAVVIGGMVLGVIIPLL